MAHTPGPWIWRGKSGSLHQTGADRLYGVVVLYPTYEYDSGIDSIVSEDDARLIAAAPALLDALRPLANMGDASIGSDIRAALRPHERPSFDAAVAAARAAIAAATGATK